jgi:hypothetical protein
MISRLGRSRPTPRNRPAASNGSASLGFRIRRFGLSPFAREDDSVSLLFQGVRGA